MFHVKVTDSKLAYSSFSKCGNVRKYKRKEKNGVGVVGIMSHYLAIQLSRALSLV